jgi:uncharacterized hydrophobic protein (TIGR00341 family)
MPLRLIEFVTGEVADGELPKLFENEQVMGVWQQRIEDDRHVVRLLADAQFTESIVERVQEKYSGRDGFRLMIFPVEATLPLPEPPEEQREQQQENEESEAQATHDRISREELYEDVNEGTQLSVSYLLLVLLSTIVVSIGMVRNDLPVTIGAMVIAPLLGPNVALALGTTLGDLPLIWRALRANGAGVLLAFAASVLMGWWLAVEPDGPAIAARTNVSLQHVLLALASGCAGALAFTRGTSAALIGVMVAVALLPPLVASGMLLGAAQWVLGLQALLLVLANIICVNLAGVVTFAAHGIRPRTWWEEGRARRSTRVALAIWILLLAVLIAVIVFTARQ